MGFSLNELVETRGWKKFMAKVYGWGASVVLVGAMFKIMHWPGAGPMIVMGLSTEAFIFFTSAFEPLYVEWDWSLAYPVLAGMDDEIDEDLKGKDKISKKSASERFDELINSADITPELFEKLGLGLRSLNKTTEKLSDVSDASVATNNYITSFDKASSKVSEFADLYGQSAQSLNNSANSLSKSYEKSAELVSGSITSFTETISQSGNKVSSMITNSGKQLSEVINSSATSFADNMNSSGNEIANNITNSGKKLSEVIDSSVNSFSNTITNSGSEIAKTITNSGTKLSEVINSSTASFADTMTNSGSEIAKMVTDSGTKLSESYSQLAEIMSSELENTKSGSKSYGEQLQMMSKNLIALNSIFELQLQDSNEHLESTKKLYTGMEDIIDNMKNSANDVKKYREEISKLSQNLSAMNTIYGNMLSAMNFSK